MMRGGSDPQSPEQSQRRISTIKIRILLLIHLIGFILIPTIIFFYLIFTSGSNPFISHGTSKFSTNGWRLALGLYDGIGSNVLAIVLAICLFIHAQSYLHPDIPRHAGIQLSCIIGFSFFSLFGGFVLGSGYANIFLLLSLLLILFSLWVLHIYSYYAALQYISKELSTQAQQDLPINFTSPSPKAKFPNDESLEEDESTTVNASLLDERDELEVEELQKKYPKTIQFLDHGSQQSTRMELIQL